MSRPPIIQRKWLVDKEFQFALIRQFIIFCALITVLAVLAFTFAYHYYGAMEEKQADAVLAQSVDQGTGFGEKVTAFDVLWPVLGVCLLVFVWATAIFGIFVSHKMAGPIYRIRTEIKEMNSLNLTGRVKLRQGDSFKNLAEDVNDLKKKWEEILGQLGTLADPACGMPPEERLAEMRYLLAGLKTRYSKKIC